MSIDYILDQVKEEHELAEILDAEGYASFESYFLGIGKALKDTFDWIANNHSTAEMIDPISLASHYPALEKIGFTALANVNIYKPPYAKADWLKYTTALLEQVTDYSNIEYRLYTPFREYLERATALEDYHNKPMADRRYQLVNVEKSKKEFSRVNVNEDDRDDLEAETATVPFQRAFRNIKSLKDIEKMIFKIHETLALVNLENLKKEEARILLQIDSLIEKVENEEKEPLSKNAKRQLAKAMMDIAEETEYMAMLLFYANTAVQAWNDTAVKLRKIEP